MAGTRDSRRRAGASVIFLSASISVIVRSDWQESARCDYVESAIARTLTGDIYRADTRAMSSINREIFSQQQNIAGRIRQMHPQIVLAPRQSGLAGFPT